MTCPLSPARDHASALLQSSDVANNHNPTLRVDPLKPRNVAKVRDKSSCMQTTFAAMNLFSSGSTNRAGVVSLLAANSSN